MDIIALHFIDFTSEVSDAVKLSRYKQLGEWVLENADKGMLTALQPVIEKDCTVSIKAAPALFYQRLLNQPEFIEHVTSLGYRWKDLEGVAKYWTDVAQEARDKAFEAHDQRQADMASAKNASNGFIN